MPLRLQTRSTARRRARSFVLAVALGLGALAPTGATHGATANTVVSATVPSATSLSVTGCASNVLGTTDLGTILPNSPYATTNDCAVAFGSSNDTAQLRIAQSDGLGNAMYQPTRGALDSTWDGPLGGGNGAFVSPPLGGSWGDLPHDMLVQPDGRTVIAGECWTGVHWDFCVARYEADGTLDATFDGPSGSGDGDFLLPLSATDDDEAYGISIQPDGKLVLSGACYRGAWYACFARLNVNGSYDPTFDGPGVAGDGRFVDLSLPSTGTSGNLMHTAIQPDGRIVVGGSCYNGTNQDFCVVRYEADGTRDPTMDGPSGSGNGFFLEPIGTGFDMAYDMELLSDGSILLGGSCQLAGVYEFCFARFGSTGLRDATFDGPLANGDGEFIDAGAAGTDWMMDVDVQPDGKVIAAGDCNTGTRDFCIARYSSVGVPDPDFDGPGGSGNGRFAEPIAAATDRIQGMELLADGRITVGGTCSNGTDFDFCYARYDSLGGRDATLDGPSGAGEGEFLLPVGTAGDQGEAMSLAPDGELVASGWCDVGADSRICLVRMDAGGVVSDYLDGTSDWNTAATTSMFGACLSGVSGGATAQWTTGACTTSDGTHWNNVPAAAEKVAFTTALEPDPANATAHFRFGVRPGSTQPAGRYLAPIDFTVLAPNA